MGNSSCKEIGEIRTSISDFQTAFANNKSAAPSSCPPCQTNVKDGNAEALQELRALIEQIPTSGVPTQTLEGITSQLETLQTTLNGLG